MKTRSTIIGCTQAHFYTMFFNISKLVSETFKNFLEVEGKYAVEFVMRPRTKQDIDETASSVDEVSIPQVLLKVNFDQENFVYINLTQVVLEVFLLRSDISPWVVDADIKTDKLVERLSGAVQKRLFAVEAVRMEIMGNFAEFARLHELSGKCKIVSVASGDKGQDVSYKGATIE